jgi:hypothetical protein
MTRDDAADDADADDACGWPLPADDACGWPIPADDACGWPLPVDDACGWLIFAIVDGCLAADHRTPTGREADVEYCHVSACMLVRTVLRTARVWSWRASHI